MDGDRMNKLESRRNEYNYSCDKMANMLGISKTYYWQIEKEKRRLTYDMAVKIANIFNTTPDDLFYERASKVLDDLSAKKTH